MGERTRKSTARRGVNLRNPLVWLRRLPYRKGYGVHSPFAYDLLTQVIYSPGRYYDYQRLDAQFTRWGRIVSHRRVAVDRLLFRLANRWQPERICAPDASERALRYLRHGCQHAKVVEGTQNGAADLIYLANASREVMGSVGEGSLLVVDHLQKNLAFWQDLLRDSRTRVTFDLYDVGLAIFNPRLQRQDYIINW